MNGAVGYEAKSWKASSLEMTAPTRDLPVFDDPDEEKPHRIRVAIIGAGWYGCHLACVLMDHPEVEVDVYERRSDLFLGSSGGTQFRLHLGFHYPRSWKTRLQIIDSQKAFIDRYHHLLADVDENVYAVAEQKSLLDFGTYVQIAKASGMSHSLANPTALGLTNVEGCLLTQEKALLVDEPREYFRRVLGSRLHLNTNIESLVRDVDAQVPSHMVTP